VAEKAKEKEDERVVWWKTACSYENQFDARFVQMDHPKCG
jgi:hypothetical protein